MVERCLKYEWRMVPHSCVTKELAARLRYMNMPGQGNLLHMPWQDFAVFSGLMTRLADA